MSSPYGNRHKKLQEYKKQWKDKWYQNFWNEFVLKYEDKLDWTSLSVNPNITIDIIKKSR